MELPSGGQWRPGDPTPGEIRAACLEIQATWTDYERWTRSSGKDLAAGMRANVREACISLGYVSRMGDDMRPAAEPMIPQKPENEPKRAFPAA